MDARAPGFINHTGKLVTTTGSATGPLEDRPHARAAEALKPGGAGRARARRVVVGEWCVATRSGLCEGIADSDGDGEEEEGDAGEEHVLCPEAGVRDGGGEAGVGVDGREGGVDEGRPAERVEVDELRGVLEDGAIETYDVRTTSKDVSSLVFPAASIAPST